MTNVIDFDSHKPVNSESIPKQLVDAEHRLYQVEAHLQQIRIYASDLERYQRVFSQDQNDRHHLAVSNIELALGGIQETMHAMNLRWPGDGS